MEFDKTRVYTAVNADELPVGSRCIFANNLNDLRHEVLVRHGNIVTLQKVLDDSYGLRFKVGIYTYPLAYLIALPKEPQYKPFSSIEKAKEIIDKHGGWVKNKKASSFLVAAYSKTEECVFLGSYWLTLKALYEHFVFLDNGSPCGELAEE